MSIRFFPEALESRSPGTQELWNPGAVESNIVWRELCASRLVIDMMDGIASATVRFGQRQKAAHAMVQAPYSSKGFFEAVGYLVWDLHEEC